MTSTCSSFLGLGGTRGGETGVLRQGFSDASALSAGRAQESSSGGGGGGKSRRRFSKASGGGGGSDSGSTIEWRSSLELKLLKLGGGGRGSESSSCSDSGRS